MPSKQNNDNDNAGQELLQACKDKGVAYGPQVGWDGGTTGLDRPVC